MQAAGASGSLEQRSQAVVAGLEVIDPLRHRPDPAAHSRWHRAAHDRLFPRGPCPPRPPVRGLAPL